MFDTAGGEKTILEAELKNVPVAIENALEERDVAALKAALGALSGSVDDHALNGFPLVVWAAISGPAGCVQAIIDAGSKPQLIRNALHTAIFSGWGQGADVSTLEVLLDAGCDVNQREDGTLTGNTPLHAAVMVASFPERSEAVARLLLERGADPKLTSVGGKTPLHQAVVTISSETVKLLIEAGADTNAKTDSGSTAVHECIFELRNAFKRSAQSEEDDSAAVASEFVHENLRLLIENGADVNTPTPKGQPPLLFVVTVAGCPERIIELMLDAGAHTDLRVRFEGDNFDLLAWGFTQDYSEQLACRFLDAGCPVDERYADFGDRPFIEIAAQFAPDLALALCHHNEEFAKRLVAHLNDDNMNMLAAAGAAGARPLVQFLFERGVSMDHVGNNGRSVMDIVEEHSPETAEYMRALG
jgi:ankyrin repeat protein